MWGYDLVNTVKQMQEEKKFRNLVWFMCSCYSGSIWNTEFSSSDNVFIITAAPPAKEGLTCDYDPDVKLSTSCCLHQSWQKFIKINEGKLDTLTLMDQYEYMYSQKTNLGLLQVEEYCAYGNWEFAKKTPITNFEGTLPKPPTQRKKQEEEDEFDNNRKKYPQVLGDYNPLKKKKKKKVGHHDSPYPGFTQFNYTGFDSDYVTCYPKTKIDLKCIKDFTEMCLEYYFTDHELVECCFSDPVTDVLRIGCSEGAKTDPETLFQMLLEFPCIIP